MTSDLGSLLIVLERERARRDASMLALRAAEQRLAQMRAQGRTLQSYRDDTEGRWGTPVGRVTSKPQLQTAHSFLQRLDSALLQHEQEHQHAQALVEQRRAQLLAAETRLASLDKLLERRRRAQQAHQRRREQKATDERAQARVAPIGGTAAPELHREPHPDTPQA